MTGHLTFRGWLRLNEAGPLYEPLARFAFGEAGCLPTCRFTDAATFANHLVSHDPSAELLAVFRVANKEYAAHRRGQLRPRKAKR